GIVRRDRIPVRASRNVDAQNFSPPGIRRLGHNRGATVSFITRADVEKPVRAKGNLPAEYAWRTRDNRNDQQDLFTRRVCLVWVPTHMKARDDRRLVIRAAIVNVETLARSEVRWKGHAQKTINVAGRIRHPIGNIQKGLSENGIALDYSNPARLL